MKRKNTILLFLVLVIIINTPIFGIKLEPLKKVQLSDKVMLQIPISFCVTGDGFFLVADFKAGDVKIYNSEGESEKVLGRKGYGPNEFAQILYCFYKNRKFIISDAGQRRIFFYDRKNKIDFVRTKEIIPPNVGFQFYFIGNKLYIAGNVRDKEGNPYVFSMIDLENDNQQITYFLPGQLQYGFNSVQKYNTELLKKPDLSAIGIASLFDIHGNFAYYSWEGDLKIFRINLKTKDIKTFGRKGPNYIKPYASKKLINAFRTRQFKLIMKERDKMSYVKKIFTTQKHVALIYEGRGKIHKPENLIQFYTFDGNFVKELSLPKEISWLMLWLDKQENVLYSMKTVTDEEFDQRHYIISYKISE